MLAAVLAADPGPDDEAGGPGPAGWSAAAVRAGRGPGTGVGARCLPLDYVCLYAG